MSEKKRAPNCRDVARQFFKGESLYRIALFGRHRKADVEEALRRWFRLCIKRKAAKRKRRP